MYGRVLQCFLGKYIHFKITAMYIFDLYAIPGVFRQVSFNISPQIVGGSYKYFFAHLSIYSPRTGYLLDIESQVGHNISFRAVADATDYVGSYKIAHHWTKEWFL